MTNILESKFVPPTRPYSQRELEDKRMNTRKKFHLGNTYAEHEKCGHFYLTKENGRKEKNIKNNGDPGSCSVCWQYRKTSEKDKHAANMMLSGYLDTFNMEPERMTYGKMDIEKYFYEWLYQSIE